MDMAWRRSEEQAKHSSGDEKYLLQSKRSRRFSACDRCFPTCWHSSRPERCFSGGNTNDRGAIQPAASRTMRSRAETAFDNMCANKINVAIIIIVVQPLCLCRRPHFMRTSLHVTKVMMLIMIMSARRCCGSYSRRSSACDSANHAILGSENV